MENTDLTNWWYYFEKVNNKKNAQCKHCNWNKPRGKDKSTAILKYHLERKQPEQWSKKLEAERLAEKKRLEAAAATRKRAATSIRDHFPKIPKDNEKEDEVQRENSQTKPYPIFGNEIGRQDNKIF
jgi:hypothetical protein